MVVKIIKAFDVYSVGTIAGFSNEVGNNLIAKGYAVQHGETKQELPNNKKTIQKA